MVALYVNESSMTFDPENICISKLNDQNNAIFFGQLLLLLLELGSSDAHRKSCLPIYTGIFLKRLDTTIFASHHTSSIKTLSNTILW